MAENSITNCSNSVSAREPVPGGEGPAKPPATTARPWVRFFARQLDYCFAQVGLVLALVAFGLEIPQDREVVLAVVATGLWIFVEAACAGKP